MTEHFNFSNRQRVFLHRLSQWFLRPRAHYKHGQRCVTRVGTVAIVTVLPGLLLPLLALATELTAIYPSFEAKLRDLLPRIAESDKQIEDIINRSLPLGAEHLLVAELVARDLKGFASNSGDVPRITRSLCLPAFQFDQHDPYAWPR